VFLNAVAQATQTRPSVPALMTSLLPTATGVWNWDDALPEEYLTLAEVLRSQGFVTGSFIQNGNAGPWAGLHQGFDAVRTRTTMDSTTETLLTREALEWLEQHREQNFFLYLHIIDPHGTFDPPTPFDQSYREARPGATPVDFHKSLDPPWVKRPTVEGRNRLYDGEVRHNDSVLEIFLDRLRSLGLAENTLLVFVADHGEFLGEYGLWRHHPPGLAQVIHVPLMFHHPTYFPDAVRIPQTVQLIDVMPTILELAGVPTGNLLLEGSSLMDLVEGRRMSYWENRLTVSEEPTGMHKGNPCECGSLFFRNWHLLVSDSLSNMPGRHLFSYRRVFDMRGDTWEADASFALLPNFLIKTRFASVVRQIQNHNIEASRNWRGREITTYELDPDVVKRLRSLGYMN
jgi:arylsulfatase A-like enzyme